MSNDQRHNVCRAFHIKLNMYAFLFNGFEKATLITPQVGRIPCFFIYQPTLSFRTKQMSFCNTIFKRIVHSTREKMAGVVKHTNVSLKREIKA